MDDDAVADQRIDERRRRRRSSNRGRSARPAPITAFAPITVPLPISARGPITAPGSMRDAALQPRAAVDVRSATSPACRQRRRPQRVRKQSARHRDKGAIRLAHDQNRDVAPAVPWQAPRSSGRRRHVSWPQPLAKLRLSRNAEIATAPARSSGATLTMRRERGRPSRGVAPVNATISSSVRPRDCRKKIGSLMPAAVPIRSPGQPRSEFGAAAETEELRAVADFGAAACRRRTVFRKRIGQVETQRAERRIPEQADADRAADARMRYRGRPEGFRPSRSSSSGPCNSTDRPASAKAAILMPISFGRKYSGVCASRLAPQYRRAAERVIRRARRQVARADTGGREAAHQIWPHLEVIEHAQLLAAPSRATLPPCTLKTLTMSENTS